MEQTGSASTLHSVLHAGLADGRQCPLTLTPLKEALTPTPAPGRPFLPTTLAMTKLPPPCLQP